MDKDKRRQYDAVYHLRNKEKRNAEARKYAARPEQKILRQLYGRWRMALAGKKVPQDEAFDKPSKEARLILVGDRERGCRECGRQEGLQLDHIDEYPNNNSIDNLQWLCRGCHKRKTRKQTLEGSCLEKHADLAQKKRFSRCKEKIFAY